MKRFFYTVILLMFAAACEVAPQKIEYGSDACHFCDMTIVDPQFSAQIVTTKGKAFKYDAIECMVHSYQQDFNDTEIALFLAASFDEPGELMDATLSTFLVSENIQSPMGENLAAFEDKAAAEKIKESHSGTLFSWKEIQEHLKL